MKIFCRSILAGIERLNLVAGAVAGALVLTFVLTILPDTLTRKFASFAIQGVAEFNILCLEIMTFLGLAAAQVRGEHFRVTIVLQMLGPRGRRVLEAVNLVLLIALALAFAWLTTGRAQMSLASNEQTFSVIAFPVWPARIAIAAGFWMLALQFAVDLIRVVLPGWAPEAKRFDETAEMEG